MRRSTRRALAARLNGLPARAGRALARVRHRLRERARTVWPAARGAPAAAPKVRARWWRPAVRERDPGAPALECRLCAQTRSALAGAAAALHRLPRVAAAWARRCLGPLGRPAGRDVEYVFAGGAHPGSRPRRYVVHVPPGYSARMALPLVVVLHGCRQTHRDIQHVSDFDAVADRVGCIVVYPYVTTYAGLRGLDCWGWWRPEEVSPGLGEVQDICAIIDEVSTRYRINRRRVHVAGLSSGAGMAVAVMVCHADRIASGAAVAGVAYSESASAVNLAGHGGGLLRAPEKIALEMNAAMGGRKRTVPLMVVHSHDDARVGIQAARNLRESWAHCFGIDLSARAVTETGETAGTGWTRTRYHDRKGRALIETLFLRGVGHGWYGGRSGRFSYPRAPDVSALMWRFFREHPLRAPGRQRNGR